MQRKREKKLKEKKLEKIFLTKYWYVSYTQIIQIGDYRNIINYKEKH